MQRRNRMQCIRGFSSWNNVAWLFCGWFRFFLGIHHVTCTTTNETREQVFPLVVVRHATLSSIVGIQMKKDKTATWSQDDCVVIKTTSARIEMSVSTSPKMCLGPHRFLYLVSPRASVLNLTDHKWLWATWRFMDLNKEPSLYHDGIDTKNCFSKRDSTSWNRFISFLPKEWIHSAHGSDTPYACDTGRAAGNKQVSYRRCQCQQFKTF